MNVKTKKWIKFSVIATIIILWIGILLIINPEKIIESIGIKNAYLATFILAAIAGGSSFTAPSMYGILIAFTLGGAPLIPIAIIAGIGSTIGDSIYMYFGKKSNTILESKLRKKLSKIIEQIEKKPKIIMPLFIFAYAAFAPIPNDLMTVSLGISGYKIKKAIIPILFGNIIYFSLLLYLSSLTAFNLL